MLFMWKILVNNPKQLEAVLINLPEYFGLEMSIPEARVRTSSTARITFLALLFWEWIPRPLETREMIMDPTCFHIINFNYKKN